MEALSGEPRHLGYVEARQSGALGKTGGARLGTATGKGWKKRNFPGRWEERETGRFDLSLFLSQQPGAVSAGMHTNRTVESGHKGAARVSQTRHGGEGGMGKENTLRKLGGVSD